MLECCPQDLDTKDIRGWSAIHRAAWNGHTDCLRILVQHGAQLNSITSQGWSPIHQAARFGFADCVQVLIDGGCDVNQRKAGIGCNGWTSLHIAAKNGHAKVCEALLEANADPFAQTSDGLSALDISNKYNHASCSILLRDLKPEAGPLR